MKEKHEYETVGEFVDPASVEAAFEDATGYAVEENKLYSNRLEEIAVMEKFQAFEAVDRKAYSGYKVLQTRFVDTDEKSRFVAKEYNTFATGEFFAQATTMSTGRLVDAIAAHHRGSRMILDVHRAFLHLPEDEVVVIEPPGEWKRREEQAGRDPTRLWLTKKVLYGRRKAPRCWLGFFASS